jgi:peptidyl-prolyl cis-trans isomerase D
MLHVMRRHSRSLLIYILFGIVIAVFIINFGPGSKGCTGISHEGFAAKIAGSDVPEQTFVHVLQLTRRDQDSGEQGRLIRQQLMDLLIAQELLAQEAERLGFRVSDDEIEDRIAQGHILILGQSRNISLDPSFSAIYKDGFDYTMWKQRFCTYLLHTTPRKFIDEQKREVLADKVRELIRVAAKVAPEDEVRRDYIAHETQARLKYVRFSAKTYEDPAEIAPADVEAYLGKNRQKVRAEYDEQQHRYKAVPKEFHVRAIFIKGGKDMPHPDLIKAEQRAKALAAKARAGADFAKLARESSEDEASKAKGGDLGWIRKGSSFGQSFDTVLFLLKKGDQSDAVRTDAGFYVIKVLDVREGDLPFDAVAKEIAEEQLRKERSQAKAKTEAEAVAAKVKAGAKLEELFPAETTDNAASADAKTAAPSKGKKGATKAPDPNAPKVTETSYFSRKGNLLEDVGVSKEAVKQVFGPLKKGENAGPFELAGSPVSYIVFRLEDRKGPDFAEFEKRKEDLRRQFSDGKGSVVLNGLARRRCIEAREAGKISVNPELFGPTEQTSAPYLPCSDLKAH